MITLALLPILISVALGLLGPRLVGSLPGRAAAVLATSVALIGALSVGLVLSAIGCLALAQWQPFAAQGHWSPATVAAHDPLPRWVVLACAALAITLLATSVVRLVNLGRRFRDSVRLCKELSRAHPGELVVLDEGGPEAYALAGLPGRTVVSRAMLRTLSAPERRALLAHERSHVENYHFVYVSLVQLAAAANPLLRPLVPAVRLAVERWADEDAARQVADRALVATTLARAGLARRDQRVPRGALAAVTSDLRQRLDSLADTERRPRTAAAIVVGLLAAALCCVASSGALGLHLHNLIEWAQTITPGRGH